MRVKGLECATFDAYHVQRLIPSTEWLQLVPFSPIFNGTLAFDLKHKNKTK
jgi:hypothetical protein